MCSSSTEGGLQPEKAGKAALKGRCMTGRAARNILNDLQGSASAEEYTKH